MAAPASRVVVIGAGFGGLSAVRKLPRQGVEIVVIDSNNFHTFQPLLYQVATAGLDADEICFPVRATLRRRRTARFVLGSVTAIDLERRTVTIDDNRVERYDHLIVAAGSISATFGVAGVAEHTFALKSLTDALDLRRHLLTRFESAAPQAAGAVDLGIAVVGGGPTGVELARMQAITISGTRYDHGLGWYRPRETRPASPRYVEHLGGGLGVYDTMRGYPDLDLVIMSNTPGYDLDALLDPIVASLSRRDRTVTPEPPDDVV